MKDRLPSLRRKWEFERPVVGPQKPDAYRRSEQNRRRDHAEPPEDARLNVLALSRPYPITINAVGPEVLARMDVLREE